MTAIILTLAAFAHASATDLRWENLKKADLASVVALVNSATGDALTVSDFRETERTRLSGSVYVYYAQQADGVAVDGRAIRVWEKPKGGAIQVEARVDSSKALAKMAAWSKSLPSGLKSGANLPSTARLSEMLRSRGAEDLRLVGAPRVSDTWVGGRLVRVYRLKTAHGTHEATMDLATGELASYRYRPHADFGKGRKKLGETSLRAQVYPIYEEVYGTHQILERVERDLRYLSTRIQSPAQDPYEPMRDRRYLYSMYDSTLGTTEEGQSQGYWATSWVLDRANAIRDKVPFGKNEFATGFHLEGRYATINLHPLAQAAFGSALEFEPSLSSQFFALWSETEVDGQSDWEMVPMAGLRGRPLMSAGEALARPARRLEDHDPAKYLNDGFDEIQVYFAVNQLFESLRPMGWSDPGLSERPFHAFLYDPDIAYKDNAYYTDDTINFTTYSPEETNLARDNSTIWHELGHGVMDRMMGTRLRLADTGGLSEGMADFVAQLVVADVTDNADFPGLEDFRILNRIGFALTNEVHDDGEAYGGAMHDLLQAAWKASGRKGLTQVTDLVLETMRLTRDHPELTADAWFFHLLFADTIPSAFRPKGALGKLVQTALSGRNFAGKGESAAAFNISVTGRKSQDCTTGECEETWRLTSESPGARENAIRLELGETETVKYRLALDLDDGSVYQFKYPVKLALSYEGGPLQGAIDWVGEADGDRELTLGSAEDALSVEVSATGRCDYANREDGSCADFIYALVTNQGEELPVAKKRFYLRIKPKN